ncbi:fucose permease [Paenibacillus cellulosilyticus]|uniref:Fucose permease n=1 Tax=Paenibacillus cellulosilyticus TaxID=375489 RepID=A0A2V2YW62_9BACL|nr:MFS transporter [Paenibacillus cellulosilyticus]PWW02856.1 fucose permease [Paenibacillus cellulosilyticus]QKS45772.1 MFS transporter [Paenibacillus cellulosilyticus]
MIDYVKSIAGLPFPVKWFLITELLFGFGMGVWNLNLNFHLKAIGITNFAIGNIIAAGSVATAIISIWAGRLCDRFGYHRSMVFGCLAQGVGMAVIAAAGDSIMLVAGQLVFSAGSAFILSSEFPFIVSLVEEKYKQLVFNMLIVSYQAAMFAGNLSGSVLTELEDGAANPYRLSIWISGVAIMLIGVGRVLLPRKRLAVQDDSEGGHSAPRMRLDAKLSWFLLYIVLASLSVGLFSSMITLICRDYFGLNEQSVGVVVSLSTVGSCIAAFLAPMLLARWGNERTAARILAINIALLLLMPVAWVYLFISLWISRSSLMAMLPGAIYSPMLMTFPESQRGSFSGIEIFAISLGTGVGASVSGYILTYASLSTLFMIGAAVMSIQLAVYTLRCRRYLAPDTTKGGEAAVIQPAEGM